jgi:monooxygenase
VEALDVLIIGAGLSGIGAAVRLAERCPQRTYTVFEGRAVSGGTWELFRYPGVRADSDMFTLAYPFHPWRRPEALADGPSILAYLRETAARFGVEPHVRYEHRVVAARWSSAEARWTVDVEVGPDRAPSSVTCRFLYPCTGYYDYTHAHEPELPGRDLFHGRIVHPQWWPPDLDVTGQRVLVIGSGATAVSLVPALAATAAHVTMVQRSPTFVISRPPRDRVADGLRAVLPAGVAHRVARAKNVALGSAFYQYCRRFPAAARRGLLRDVRRRLPAGYPLEDFSPRYAPWDQRLCAAPDGDLFQVIHSGRASVVTAALDSFTAAGVRLTDGRELPADVIVTATGLRLLPLGGMSLVIDGQPLDVGAALVYRGFMLSGVPNAAWSVGYSNASWTLRSDLTARAVCRLLNYLDRHGFRWARPRAAPAELERRPVIDLTAGYVQRAAGSVPRQGDRAPWRVHQSYLLDLPEFTFSRVNDGVMEFGPRSHP